MSRGGGLRLLLGLGEHGLQLARLKHLQEDVAAAHKVAVDEALQTTHKVYGLERHCAISKT